MITIPRSGDRPLHVDGRCIAEASSQRDRGPCETRHWALALYRTNTGRFVLAASYRTRWHGEETVDLAWHSDDTEALVEVLKALDPLQYATGLRAVQKRRGDDGTDPRSEAMRIAWGVAVSDLLRGFPETLS